MVISSRMMVILGVYLVGINGLAFSDYFSIDQLLVNLIFFCKQYKFVFVLF